MALSRLFFVSFLLLLSVLFSLLLACLQQPLLSSLEQESAYQVLESINSAIPWRTIFPDDLCSSAPHGVVCEYFPADSPNATDPDFVHITELSFGYVSEYASNPPCTSHSTLNPRLFTSFNYLRKLFFYKCFTGTRVSIPNDLSPSFLSSLQELVFIDNPTLVGPLSGILGNFTNLRRSVLTGNGLYGEIPQVIADLVDLEEITLSRNQLSGRVPLMSKLKKLKILDLSHNYLDGDAPKAIGYLSQLLKLDLSWNGFNGKIPETFGKLKNLEFLDLSFNHFGNFGIPMFLSEMPRLRELYLSGNLLGGQIPDIWERLGRLLRIGFSSMGLVGEIPASMGVYLRNLSYLGLDNNKLQGKVPEEFGLMKFVNGINLENNNFTGGIPFSTFSAKIGKRLRLGGNPQLCVNPEELRHVKNDGSLGQLKPCRKPDTSHPIVFSRGCSMQAFASHVLHFLTVSIFALQVNHWDNM